MLLLTLITGSFLAYSASYYYHQQQAVLTNLPSTNHFFTSTPFLSDLQWCFLSGHLAIRSYYTSAKSTLIWLLFLLLLWHLNLLVLYDYYEQAYPTVLLVIPAITGLIHLLILPSSQYLLSNLLFLSILIILAFQGKMGSGDVYFFILLALNFPGQTALRAFLFGSLLAIAHIRPINHFQRPKQNQEAHRHYPLLPYLYWGLNLQFWL